jgi:hypothetical protein
MMRATVILTASASVLALAVLSWAEEKVLPKQTVTIAGTVESIDQANRVVNIKTGEGKFVAVDVPESAKRLSEVKVGDKVKATYHNLVRVRLKEPGEPPVDTKEVTSGMGREARPGGTESLERTITATIAEIDKSTPSITFVGPNGWKYSRRVVDREALDKVKVGDKVDITWNTDVTVSVE